MIELFKKKKLFFLLFFIILFTDIIFHNIDGFNKYRYASKLLITNSLMFFFYFNSSHFITSNRVLVIIALLFSFLGDFILISNPGASLFSIGISMYMISKITYAVVFSFSAKFDIDRSLPFLTVTLLYCLLIVYFIFNGQGIPVLIIYIYIFVSLIMLKVAYLRYKLVSRDSYLIVLFGCISFIISETVIGLDKFFAPIFYESIFGMLFYGFAQFLIIIGLIIQKNR